MGRKKKEEKPAEPFSRSVVFVKDMNTPQRPKRVGRFKCCR